MSRKLDYSHSVSLRISQVMDEIGVNEKILMKRRRSFQMVESLQTLTQHLLYMNVNMYNFGSQTEGTTTGDLHSDIDCLLNVNDINVIQDWSEWKHGKPNFLMIQDESASPGYCLLQSLRIDAPLPEVNVTDEHFVRDGMGRILIKNTIVHAGGNVRHGPAISVQGVPGITDKDYVPAFFCHTYPVQARQWLDPHREGYWPSDDVIQFCHNAGCFVVAVGNKGSKNEIFEWRISTSLAERCLMFNLNITQLRCYVLMKMIIKTYISPQYPESISSYMCKTVLLHCISNTRTYKWKDSTLLTCLSFCLLTLYNCVLDEYCPHFLISKNNLMMRRFSQEHKPYILEILHYVIESNGMALLGIECDRFGIRLHRSLNGVIERNRHFMSTPVSNAGYLLMALALNINACFSGCLREMKDLSARDAVRMISSMMSKLNNTQHTHLYSKCFISQQLCHTMGTILASSNIDRRENLTYTTMSFILLGLKSDEVSDKLKLASAFYCKGDIERTELILRNIEERYDLSVVEPICACYPFQHTASKERFDMLCYESNQEYALLKNITASCVYFLRCEVNCCPQELRHEMFRSTMEDFSYRGELDNWMDIAVVDSLPFLYFLQYKTYSCLGKVVDKSRALSNLVRTIEREPNLGHRETALNLLGQCMENENRKDNALNCYRLSLNVRGRNNAANFLISRLQSSVINGHES